MMKTSINPLGAPRYARCLTLAMVMALLLGLGARQLEAAVLTSGAKPYGNTYGQWSAAWWTWAMSQPVDGHPFIDSPSFNVTAGQSGQVWFLGSPFGTVVRDVEIPQGKALFVGILNAEASNLEGLGNTEAEQRDTANFLANHIVNVAASVDGVPVANISSYRVTSPQFTFTAPTPWIFGDTGGTGTSVADGYYLMIAPFATGIHVLQYSGAYHFDAGEIGPDPVDFSLDTTYNITVR